MKEKDPIARAVNQVKNFELSNESTRDLTDFLRERILRDKKIDRKYFSKYPQKNS